MENVPSVPVFPVPVFPPMENVPSVPVFPPRVSPRVSPCFPRVSRVSVPVFPVCPRVSKCLSTAGGSTSFHRSWPRFARTSRHSSQSQVVIGCGGNIGGNALAIFCHTFSAAGVMCPLN